MSVCGLKGGMKAVMWTDVVQTCFMFAGIVAVIIQGSVDHGGFSNIWSTMYEGDRIRFWEYAHLFILRTTATNHAGRDIEASVV